MSEACTGTHSGLQLLIGGTGGDRAYSSIQGMCTGADSRLHGVQGMSTGAERGCTEGWQGKHKG